MKKLLIGAVSAAAMMLAFTGPAAAISVSDFCKANSDFGLTHGECTGGINKSVPETCKLLRDLLPPANYEAFFGGTGVGACVSFIRHAIKAV